MKQIAIALDQVINTLIPPYNDAWADETFSSRCWRNGRDLGGTWKVLQVCVDTLLFFDPQHCFSSYVSEVERMQSPICER